MKFPAEMSDFVFNMAASGFRLRLRKSCVSLRGGGTLQNKHGMWGGSGRGVGGVKIIEKKTY